MIDSKSIEVNELSRSFDKLLAVDSVSFQVAPGEVYGLLGPNGAGKSTIIRILCTLLRPTSGSARIAGYDITRQASLVRQNIGLVTEKIILYERLTAEENLRLFGRLNHLPDAAIRKRIDELLTFLDMQEWRRHLIGTFSTGMRQRMNIARALLHQPKILFLDEPTLGLDPQTTHSLHEMIKQLSSQGMTIILTTHIMSEAETMSHRIAIIDHGKIVAEDTPKKLKQTLLQDDAGIVEVVIAAPNEKLVTALTALNQVATLNQAGACYLKIQTNGDDALYQIVNTINQFGITIKTIHTLEPTLEDVFLHLTGRELRNLADQEVNSIRVSHRARHSNKRAR